MSDMKSDRRIDFIPLSQLAKSGAKRNPKDHDIGAISESLKRAGYVEPVVIDERTGRLVAGHGRVETLEALKRDKAEAPAGVRDDGGEWLVPVMRGWASESDSQAEAYLLASNRTTELGGWNQEQLEGMLKDLASQGELEGSGYDGDDIDQMLHATAGEDDLPGEPQNVWVKPGDMFQLGAHRILCGDSTSKQDVERALGGEKPFLMVTDPPYGVEYDPKWRNNADGGSRERVGVVEGDDRSDWTAAYKLFSGDVAYVWHADRFTGLVQSNIESAGLAVENLIIWAKSNFVLGRGHYHWQHEPCWYAVREGATNTWHGDRSQTTLWEVGLSSQSKDAGDQNSGIHGTPKPVELYRRAIKNSSKLGMSVYEPFSGSGTSIIACEELQRKCLAIEISPAYVQTAIERWEKFTGQKHVKL